MMDKWVCVCACKNALNKPRCINCNKKRIVEKLDGANPKKPVGPGGASLADVPTQKPRGHGLVDLRGVMQPIHVNVSSGSGGENILSLDPAKVWKSASGIYILFIDSAS